MRDKTGFLRFAWLLLLLLSVPVPLLLPASPAAAATEAPLSAGQRVLEVFVRDGCPHCAEAKLFLSAFGAERPWLQIVYRSVDRDPAARDELTGYFEKAGMWPPGVPTFVMDGKVLVGFDDAARTGPLLEALVGEASTVPGDVQARLPGTLSPSELGLPLFTLTLGLLDGFNPCAMWLLLFLLSLLVHLRDRKRMALVAGTFVLVSGAIYYAFMAAWLNIFLAIGGINIKDFFAWGRGPSLSVPDSAKPGLYARMRAVLAADRLLPSLAGVAALAIVANFVELLCTAGLPAIYTSVLAQQDLSRSAYYAYLGLYILGYIADDSLMVGIAVYTLSRSKLTEQTGRWLKLLSGIVMLALGLALILRPEWLF